MFWMRAIPSNAWIGLKDAPPPSYTGGGLTPNATVEALGIFKLPYPRHYHSQLRLQPPLMHWGQLVGQLIEPPLEHSGHAFEGDHLCVAQPSFEGQSLPFYAATDCFPA